MSSSIPAVVGPTGVGKTAFALKLAKQQNAELISADARQIYIGMDIATGKEVDHGSWSQVNNRRTLAIDGVSIHGLDLVYPDQTFSVADWYRLALTLIDEIQQRHHQPMIVGGTGFYLDALMGKIETLNVPPDPKLRQQLARLSAQELFTQLSTIDPSKAQSLNHSDTQNKVRLIRAIEVAQSKRQEAQSNPAQPTPSVQLDLIGLTLPRDQLFLKVDSRIDQMIEQGLIAETQALLNNYDSSLPSMTAIGYAEISAHLNHQLTLEQALAKIKIRTHQYIKRQYTWFNHRPVKWITPGSDSGSSVIQ